MRALESLSTRLQALEAAVSELPPTTSPFECDTCDLGNRSKMKIEIDQLTEAELIALNRRIVERLKFLHHMRAHMDMLEFRIGDHIWFQADRSQTVHGIVTRYNKKTVSVVSDDGRRWTVPPGLLHQVPPPASEPEAKNVTPGRRSLVSDRQL